MNFFINNIYKSSLRKSFPINFCERRKLGNSLRLGHMINFKTQKFIIFFIQFDPPPYNLLK